MSLLQENVEESNTVRDGRADRSLWTRALETWRRSIEPTNSVVTTEERRRLKLLAMLAFVYAPINFVVPFVAILLEPGYSPLDDPVAIVWWGNGIVFLVAYGFSRTRIYRAATWILFVALIMTSFAIATVDAQVELFLPWLLAPVLVASLLLPLLAAFIVGIASLGAGLRLLTLASAANPSQTFLIFGFIVGSSFFAVILAFARFHDAARLRREQRALDATKSELRNVRDQLEQMRVGEQTEALLRSIRHLRQQIAERIRTEEELERRNRALSLLNRVIVGTTSTLEIRSLLQVACQELAMALDVSQAKALLLDMEDGSASVAAEYGMAGRDNARGLEIPNLEGSVAGFLMKQSQALVLRGNGLTSHAIVSQLIPADTSPGSMAILPLLASGNVIGAIVLVSEDANAFGEDDRELATSVAASVSQSLYVARLFAAEREQRALAEALRNTASVISSSLRLDEVLDRLLVNVGLVVAHDSGNVMLVQDGFGEVVRVRGYLERGELPHFRRRKFDLEEIPLLRRMRDSQQPAWVPDTKASEEWVNYPEVDWVRSYVGAPICIEEKLIGFIHLNSSKQYQFSQLHGHKLQAFADQAAVAIQNARLHERVAEQATELEQRVKARTAELEALNADLQRLARVKDEFVSNISHELRTPITNLLLRHDLIVRRPDRLEKHLGVIHRETKRLHRIIEDLLQLSRLDRGQVTLRRSQVNLNELVQRYVADRSPLAADKEISLDLETEPDIPLVLADEALLGQTLSIMLTNAVSYSSAGAVVTVNTKLGEKDGQRVVGFSVTDRGPGIHPDEQPNVFDRFFRGSAALDSGASGTGLGLAIAREIVTRHGGEIELRSSGIAGELTSFSVWLPQDDASSNGRDFQATKTDI